MKNYDNSAKKEKEILNLPHWKVREKVFIVPKAKIDNHNIDIKSKLEANRVKVRKVFIERTEHLIHGELGSIKEVLC